MALRATPEDESLRSSVREPELLSNDVPVSVTFNFFRLLDESATYRSLSRQMNTVFPPWPIRELRDRSDGIPESGRED